MDARSGLVVLAALGVAPWWLARRFVIGRGWAIWPARLAVRYHVRGRSPTAGTSLGR